MEYLNRNIASLILDRLCKSGNRVQANKCSLLNKHWYAIVKDYYYKNQTGILLWKNYNPLKALRRPPKLILSWHLVHALLLANQNK
jgi:hypothetical protein